MSAIPKQRMTVDEFLAWAEGRPGRHELQDGRIIALSPERLRHLEAKSNAMLALRHAIGRSKLDCYALPDGATVRIDERTAFEPDALVYCGPRLPPKAIEIPKPIIVVEVLSDSTARRDANEKLIGYFTVAAVHHYLIVDADKRNVVLHKRGADDLIETRIIHSGLIKVDPPGLNVPVEDMFAEPDKADQISG